MKNFLLLGVLCSIVFANTLEDRVKILEEKVAKLEQKLNMVDKTQKNLKQDIANSTVLKCNKLRIKKYSFEYLDSGFIKNYDFKYVLENDYNKTIKYVYAQISYFDNNHIQMVEDYIKKSIVIKPNQQVTVKTNYLIDEGGLAESLKDTPKKDIRIEFKPFEIDFEDGQILKCQ
jgi:hypothetical protein